MTVLLPSQPVMRPPPRGQTLRVIAALMLREMGSTYGRQPGGYLWAVLQPVGSIAMMAAAFSLITHRPALGSSFILFYATGYLPFDLFGKIADRVGGAIRSARALLAYPRVSWIDTILARLFLALLTQAVIFLLVIGAILALVPSRSQPAAGPILESFGLAATIGLAIGLLNCLISGHFPLWDRIWAILRTPLIFGSGVLFLYDSMPRFVQGILWWNPLTHAIARMRAGFYPSYRADFVSLTYGFGVALALIALCLPLLRQGYRAALDR